MFVVDSGDLHLRSAHMTDAEEALYRRRAEIYRRAHERMGMDAMAVGELDLALGWPFLGELYRDSPVRLVSANLVVSEDGAALLPDRVMVERGGMRVAFVGAYGEHLVLRADLRPRIVARPALPAVVRSVQWARREGADLVVLLSHLGLFAERRLASRIRGIDVILGGHSRDLLRRPVMAGGVPIFQAGTRGKYLGRLELLLDPRAAPGTCAPMPGEPPPLGRSRWGWKVGSPATSAATDPASAPATAATTPTTSGAPATSSLPPPVRIRYRNRILLLDRKLPSSEPIRALVDDYHRRARERGVVIR